MQIIWLELSSDTITGFLLVLLAMNATLKRLFRTRQIRFYSGSQFKLKQLIFKVAHFIKGRQNPLDAKIGHSTSVNWTFNSDSDNDEYYINNNHNQCNNKEPNDSKNNTKQTNYSRLVCTVYLLVVFLLKKNQNMERCNQ